MDKTAFDKYYQERYLEQMEFYDKGCTRNRTRYKRFQWTLIILSALAPVLAAINTGNVSANATLITTISIALVIVSSIVAILTTGLKTFNYLELWVTYRTTYEKLKPEIYYYNFGIGPYAETGVNKGSLFVVRVEAILDKEHNQWLPAKKSQEVEDDIRETDRVVVTAPKTIGGNGVAIQGGETKEKENVIE